MIERNVLWFCGMIVVSVGVILTYWALWNAFVSLVWRGIQWLTMN
jgi:hypothetical protein